MASRAAPSRPARRSAARGTLHVVYACPARHGSPLGLLKRRLAAACTGTPFEIAARAWRSPLSAPTSITHAIVEAFGVTHRIALHDHTSTGAITLGPRDLFIGHPWPDEATKDPAQNHWRRPSEVQTTNMTVRKYPGDPRVILMSPFCGATETSWVRPLTEICRNWILICGDVWRGSIQAAMPWQSPCATHTINMFVYPDHYPLVKGEFAPPGRRRFLYIGRVSGEKNTALLSSLAAAAPDFSCGFITNEGEISGCHRVSAARQFTPAFARSVLSHYDFLISPSVADAQATTVLEAMAWGLGVAATRESGYDHPSILSLQPHDLAANLEAVERMQRMPAAQLAEVQRHNRGLVETKYSAAAFRKRLVEIVGQITGAL
jgi:glycosyltransferase involved in cell wall biosynthesis